jgi:lysophospholipase L1-like esterase
VPRLTGCFGTYAAVKGPLVAAVGAGAPLLKIFAGYPLPRTPREITLGGEGMSPDGVHSNDEGYAVAAAGLRELGYEPLSPS